MSENDPIQDDERDERDDEFSGEDQGSDAGEMEHVVPVRGMYNDYFLDYASYVILERAVPHQHDGGGRPCGTHLPMFLGEPLPGQLLLMGGDGDAAPRVSGHGR